MPLKRKNKKDLEDKEDLEEGQKRQNNLKC